jgi:hypothetical protein
MKKALLLLAIFASLFLAAVQTQAQCSCFPEYRDITAQKEFSFAYAVFVGKIIAIKTTPPDAKGHYSESVTFQVTRAWKNDLDSNLTITNKIQGCVNGFAENEEWLVYAYRYQDLTLGTYCCCTRTTRLAKAEEDLKTFADYRPAKILRPEDHKP